MTATTRSASSTPASMSFASSEASLTECSGTLRTSIGAGTGSLFLRRGTRAGRPRHGPRPGPARGGEEGVPAEDRADVVPADGVEDVLERGDDGAAAAPLDEAERGLDLRAHAAAGELARRRELAQLGGVHAVQRPGRRGAEADHHVRDVGGEDEGVRSELAGQQRRGQVLVDDRLDTP